jgi:uroporphyrinogen-III synthase
MMRLLVTRPEPDGERTAALLRARGHAVQTLPLLRIEAIVDADFGAGPWAAVAFTSAHAVHAVTTHRHFGDIAALPAYVVGARTQGAAAAAGFAPVFSADGDVEDLVHLIRDQAPGGDLLYLAGQERAGDLAGALRALGKIVETVVVYRAVIATDAAAQLGTALRQGGIDAVLHYSARSAAAFVAAAPDGDFSIHIKHFCLSSRVAAPLLAAGATTVVIAEYPNENALLACVGSS